jgi:hypothetical protein
MKKIGKDIFRFKELNVSPDFEKIGTFFMRSILDYS